MADMEAGQRWWEAAEGLWEGIYYIIFLNIDKTLIVDK